MLRRVYRERIGILVSVDKAGEVWCVIYRWLAVRISQSPDLRQSMRYVDKFILTCV